MWPDVCAGTGGDLNRSVAASMLLNICPVAFTCGQAKFWPFIQLGRLKT
jgi:hypothetical protein